jgi:hypothetical protein
MSKPKCSICKGLIEAHDQKKALECFNKSGILPDAIKMSEVMAVGYSHAGLKGTGQRHANKKIITLNFGGIMIDTKKPNLIILQKLLQPVGKEKSKDGKDGTDTETGNAERDRSDTGGIATRQKGS